ncbi:MAG: hypothetical protein GKS02_12915 [Alphaproteobacteria bacterium]|nr:hypothetical protein [Alphaproteobacteria bacterium]
MKKLFFIIGLPLMLAGGSASAQLWSGNDYRETCTLEPDEYKTSVCSAFIIGIAQAGRSNKIFCMPEDVTNGQTHAIVNSYINDNPEERHLAASELIVTSLVKAFPCQPK